MICLVVILILCAYNAYLLYEIGEIKGYTKGYNDGANYAIECMKEEFAKWKEKK